MMAGPGKSDAVSHASGLGRVRAHTITLDGHVIAIQNIGTIRILRGQRSWWLFLLGALVIAGAATQLNTYGAVAIAGIGLGIALIIGNLAQKVESGLSIGTADGRTTLIVSRDPIFLQRLLQLLVDKIDTGDETLLANFDIAHNTITAVGAAVAIGDNVLVAGGPFVAPAARSEPDAATQADESEAALFGEPEPPDIPATTRPAQPEPRKSFDPLLDGGGRPTASDDDWLSRPRPTSSPPPVEPDGGGARILLALLIVVLLGAGVFAAWYFTGQTGPANSISLLASPQEAATEIAPAETPTESPPVPETALPATPASEPPVAVEEVTPPSPVVDRASGQ